MCGPLFSCSERGFRHAPEATVLIASRTKIAAADIIVAGRIIRTRVASRLTSYAPPIRIAPWARFVTPCMIHAAPITSVRNAQLRVPQRVAGLVFVVMPLVLAKPFRVTKVLRVPIVKYVIPRLLTHRCPFSRARAGAWTSCARMIKRVRPGKFA